MSARTDLTNAALALGHPLRRAILQQVALGVTTPKAIAEATGSSLGTTAYHCRMLLDYGVLEVTHTEPRRGALQHFYGFTDAASAGFHEVAKFAATAAHVAAGLPVEAGSWAVAA